MSDGSSEGAETQQVRRIGHAASAEHQFTRVASSLTRYPRPLDFRALCVQAVPVNTRYLVLDLDRTIHRGRNLGELLGWEVAALVCYGPEALRRLESTRPRGRFFWDPAQLERLAVYTANNVRAWAFPGLSYLLWCNLAERYAPLERWAYGKFGPEPTQAVQRIPQTALLHLLTTLPVDTLRDLAQRVWDRFADDQVVEAADLAWLRARCPRIQIILTSASPEPTLRVAGAALGVDAIEFSGAPEHEGRFAAPFWVDRRFALGRLERIAPPRQVRINSGAAKIEALRARFPDIFDDDSETVGISDTGYGEDHVWAQYFKVVIDVNSTAPFPPIVAFDSPLREIHSARLLTRAERAAQVGTESGRQTLRSDELERRVAKARQRIELLARELQGESRRIRPELDVLQRRMSGLHDHMERTIASYNAAPERDRARFLKALRNELKDEASLRRSAARAERPLSLLRMEINRGLRAASRSLDHGAEVAGLEAHARAPDLEAGEHVAQVPG